MVVKYVASNVLRTLSGMSKNAYDANQAYLKAERLGEPTDELLKQYHGRLRSLRDFIKSIDMDNLVV